MIDALRSWLLGIVAVALCIALTEQLVSQSGIRRVLRLAGGLLLLMAMFGPLRQISGARWDLSLFQPETDRETLEQELRESSQGALEQGIEEALTSYIWDKGQSIGADCQVSVTVSTDEAGLPVIGSVTLTGTYHAALSKWLEDDMGIPPEHQIWQEE